MVHFIDSFNAAFRASLDRLFASPCVLILDTETHLFERYSDAVDCGVLKKSGCSYSKINSLEALYQD